MTTTVLTKSETSTVIEDDSLIFDDPDIDRIYPTECYEIVDGQAIEKNEMTAVHGRIQGNIYYAWRLHDQQNRLGGIAYTQPSCYTVEQRRRLPDVAYATADYLSQFGQPLVFPQSLPLIAEIVSPTDIGEQIFLKAQEYLASGAVEVWLVFPQSELVFIAVSETIYFYDKKQIAISPKVLPDFSIPVQELLA